MTDEQHNFMEHHGTLKLKYILLCNQVTGWRTVYSLVIQLSERNS